LGVPGGFEPLHPSLPLARRLVGVLGAAIEIGVCVAGEQIFTLQGW
jgi:hypothetical protein